MCIYVYLYVCTYLCVCVCIKCVLNYLYMYVLSYQLLLLQWSSLVLCHLPLKIPIQPFSGHVHNIIYPPCRRYSCSSGWFYAHYVPTSLLSYLRVPSDATHITKALFSSHASSLCIFVQINKPISPQAGVS